MLAGRMSAFHFFGPLSRRKHRYPLEISLSYVPGALDFVTLEDILETLPGTEIMDETDRVRSFRRYAKQRWVRKLGA